MTGERSGVWSVLTGVGTATMMNLAFRSSVSSAVNLTVVVRMASSPTSRVGSRPDRYTSILALFKSNPMTSRPFLAKAMAMGIPT